MYQRFACTNPCAILTSPTMKCASWSTNSVQWGWWWLLLRLNIVLWKARCKSLYCNLLQISHKTHGNQACKPLPWAHNWALLIRHLSKSGPKTPEWLALSLRTKAFWSSLGLDGVTSLSHQIKNPVLNQISAVFLSMCPWQYFRHKELFNEMYPCH